MSHSPRAMYNKISRFPRVHSSRNLCAKHAILHSTFPLNPHSRGKTQLLCLRAHKIASLHLHTMSHRSSSLTPPSPTNTTTKYTFPSTKFPNTPPPPPSDSDQEDFIYDDDEYDEYGDEMTQVNEPDVMDANHVNASGKKRTIARDDLVKIKESVFRALIHSQHGNNLVRFTTHRSSSKNRSQEDISLHFESQHLENALRDLGMIDALRSDLILARKNKDKQVVTLRRTENAWVPGAFATHVNTPEKVRSEMTDILNKMTPEKYDRLFRKFWNIKGVQEADNIRVMVRCIQEKALFEPNFSNVYAKLCRDIIDERGYTKKNEFKTVLLKETQQEFETEHKEISGTEPAFKDKSAEEIEDMRAQAKRRALGNIRFIGELYKQKILAGRIIHQVIRELLLLKQTPDPEELEVLCALLATVGKQLDETKKEFMDVYFNRLKKLTESPKLKTRIIFMIENVIELRSDDWVPRIKEEKAQKLKQVLENHASEEQERMNEMREKKRLRKQR